jgi:hypothetical protein
MKAFQDHHQLTATLPEVADDPSRPMRTVIETGMRHPGVFQCRSVGVPIRTR